MGVVLGLSGQNLQDAVVAKRWRNRVKVVKARGTRVRLGPIAPGVMRRNPSQRETDLQKRQGIMGWGNRDSPREGKRSSNIMCDLSKELALQARGIYPRKGISDIMVFVGLVGVAMRFLLNSPRYRSDT
jgi:hypothetical protein